MHTIAHCLCITVTLILAFMAGASHINGDGILTGLCGLSAVACLVGSCLVEISAQRKDHPDA